MVMIFACVSILSAPHSPASLFRFKTIDSLHLAFRQLVNRQSMAIVVGPIRYGFSEAE